MKPKKTQQSPSQAKRSLSRGFTLVELLVVITIVAVLAALTFAITRNVRSRAFQANAMESLRHVAAANAAYSAENNGDINTLRWIGDPKEGGGGAWVKNSFWGRLQPLLFPDAANNNQNRLKVELTQHLDRLLNSSDADVMSGTVVSGAKIYHDGSGLPVPFAFNMNLYKWGTFLKSSSFSDPGQVIYATYGFGLFNEQDGSEYVPMPKTQTTPANNIYYMSDRTALAAFLDGHVEAVSASIPDRRFK